MTDIALGARGIYKHYWDGDRKNSVLQDIHLELGVGETVALVGRSGAGKTSLLNILGALDPDFEGDVSVGGHVLREKNDTELASLRNKYLGFVFQGFNLLRHNSVLENVWLAGRFSPEGVCEKRALKLIERVGLEGKQGQRPATLSGGERQRVAIARALYSGPKVVLCDEPTGNLDSATAGDILELFGELSNEGVTFLVVTHDDKVADIAHRTLQLVDGVLQ